MNVPFTINGGDEALEKKFLDEAKKHKLYTLAGHRSVGGCRASLYNGMPLEGVAKLTDFMKSFMDENRKWEVVKWSVEPCDCSWARSSEWSHRNFGCQLVVPSLCFWSRLGSCRISKGSTRNCWDLEGSLIGRLFIQNDKIRSQQKEQH